jgi:hypothetical protein
MFQNWKEQVNNNARTVIHDAVDSSKLSTAEFSYSNTRKALGTPD